MQININLKLLLIFSISIILSTVPSTYLKRNHNNRNLFQTIPKYDLPNFQKNVIESEESKYKKLSIIKNIHRHKENDQHNNKSDTQLEKLRKGRVAR